MMLLIAFLAVVGSFYASSFIVQRSSAEVASLSTSIIENSAPSIEHMARLRRAVLEAELAVTHFVDVPEERAEHGKSLETAVSDARHSARDYAALPTNPGEERLRLDLQAELLHFESAVNRTRELAVSGATEAAVASLGKDVGPARKRAVDQATAVIENNAKHGREAATMIREMRRRTLRLANSLNGICGLFAVFVGYSLYRQGLARRKFAAEQVASLETRAKELEQFAGRVAHDIRNPLAAARAAAELVTRRSEDDVTRNLNERITRSLTRADAITTDLLSFARSGANPDPGARTSPRAVIQEVIADLAHDAERAGIDLRVERLPAVGVACSTGVYLSLLGNLVRNAIKYMRDAPTRRITVRLRDEGDFVRTEVIDTGPGIAEEIQASLFEPYIRGPSGGAEGLGLGLATVKRLAEAHGGRVGVTSARGKGSTFWFTLSRAPLDENDDEAEVIEEHVVRH